jgi:predicted ArsR family transcriptional regulator
MAELRLTPSGWLLIENHCPIFAAASSCSAFCVAELSLFKQLLEGYATVERSDYLLEGARRCAYRIQPIDA